MLDIMVVLHIMVLKISDICLLRMKMKMKVLKVSDICSMELHLMNLKM